jgi:hypothetical protein
MSNYQNKMLSKPQIRFKGKASGRSGKSLFPAYVKYVSIYRRPVMHLSVIEWIANPASLGNAALEPQMGF